MSFRSFLWPWIVVAIGLITIPYWVAAQLTPPNAQFLGALVNPEDLSVYLAAMRQGAEGAWLFTVTFTPETIIPKLSYPFYLLLGKLLPVLPVEALELFHASRVLSGLILLLAVAVWLNLLDIGQATRDAFVLIFLSGGWGWLFLGMGWLLPDIHVAEWTPFLTIFYAPHFTLGLLAELLVMAGLLAAYRRRSGGIWPLATAVTGAAGLTLLYPYRIIPLMGVIGVYLLVEMGWGWRQRPLLLMTGFGSLAVSGVMSLYYGLIARSDPYWNITYIVQNSFISPNPFETFMSWGVPGLLAILTVVVALKKWSQIPDAIRLCVIWFGVGALSLYLPVTFQARFALGVYLPLAVIAAWGLHALLLPKIAPWQNNPLALKLTPTPVDTVRRVILILAVPSVLVFTGMAVRRTAFFPEQYFLPVSEVRAVEWLAANSGRDDLVLAGSRVGNYSPRHIQGRVFVGQYYLTVESDRKAALARQFFLPETTDEWRLDFLQGWGITHIYYGYDESKVGPPPDLPGWAVVYDVDGVLIYRLISERGGGL